MQRFLEILWGEVTGRWGGPLNIRLILQPCVAIFLAIRSGLKDARSGEPPYGWAIAFHSNRRIELAHSGRKDVTILFLVAVVLEVMYQLIVFRWVYPGQALLVAILIAIVPYVAARGLSNRISKHVRKPENNS